MTCSASSPTRRNASAGWLRKTERVRTKIDAEPFRIDIPDSALVDLRERLKRTRWPIEAKAPPWTYGASLAYMKDVVAYWRDHYDWRKSEAALNRFPNYKAT